jgi:hypothetical protein
MYNDKLNKLIRMLDHINCSNGSIKVAALKSKPRDPLAVEENWLQDLEKRIKEMQKGSQLTEEHKRIIFRLRYNQEGVACVYCGRYLSLNKSNIYLDRVDNNEGYNLGNVVFCCEICNQVKANTDLESLLDFSLDVTDNIKYTSGRQGKQKIQEEANFLKDLVEDSLKTFKKPDNTLPPLLRRERIKGTKPTSYWNDITIAFSKEICSILNDKNKNMFINPNKRNAIGSVIGRAISAVSQSPEFKNKFINWDPDNVINQVKARKSLAMSIAQDSGAPWTCKEFIRTILSDEFSIR